MNIAKTSSLNERPVNFQAKTVINAPDSMLSKEDKDYFKNLGSQLGTIKDSIEITLGEPEPSKVDPNVKGYPFIQKIAIKKKNGAVNETSVKFVPYIKNGEENEQLSPKAYMGKAFERISKMFQK